MGNVLRWLVCVILALGVGALVLAILLFNKRELLVGRTHLLETQLIKVAKTIEAVDPGDAGQPHYTEKDLSPVTSAAVEAPEHSDFWGKYQYKLEPSSSPVLTLDFDTDQKKLQLRQYYQMAAGKCVSDPLTGKKSVKGPGTMQELMDQMLDRAQKQQATLNKTREELLKIRQELQTTIDDYNKIKTGARADKKAVEEKQAQIAKLNDEAQAAKRQIDTLEGEKRALNAEVAEEKNEVSKQKSQIDELDKQVKSLTKKLEVPEPMPRAISAPVQASDLFLGKLTPGDKGKIIAMDNTLKFVVAELSDSFMTELLGPNREGSLPQVELMVRRPGLKSSSGDFVTRIRLRQALRQQNLVVADILIDWEQSPIEKNDVIFF